LNKPTRAIEVALSPVGEHGSAWGRRYAAQCTIAGMAFRAESTSGASCELARQLVDAGVPDQPMVLNDGALVIHVKSMHKHAGRTMTEGNQPIRFRRYTPRPDIDSFPARRVLERV
jgi:hypothetical protein